MFRTTGKDGVPGDPKHQPDLGRVLVVLEVVALVGFNGDEAVRRLFLHDQTTPGAIAFFGSGAVISALALLRRRYPGAIAQLAASAFALSLICSAVGFFAKPAAPFGGDGEALGQILRLRRQ
ncbi:hypothetical protein ACWF0M_24680 [Kribbella sp. NPDC055110]